MLEWWENLSFTYQFFYFIGLGSTLILIIQTLLVFIGIGDYDIDADIDMDISDTPHASGGGIVSVRTIVAFMVGFGWTGVICLKNNLTVIPTLLISVIVGFIFLLIVFFLMVGLFKLRSSGNIDNNKIIGQEARVYSTIPGKSAGKGKITITIQNRVRELSAMTISDEDLTSGTKVKIIELIDPINAIVEPVRED